MYASPPAQSRVGSGRFYLQHHGRLDRADLQGFSIDGSAALYQKGSQPENSVSTRLGSTLSAFEPSSETYLPSDLQLFSNLLDGHLATAWNALIERDGDVAHLIATALTHKASLLEQVFRAFETLRAAGKQVPFCVHGLRTSAWTRERQVALSTIEMAQACVVTVKKCLIGMRASYVALLEEVHYLVDCSAVELDYAHQCADAGCAKSTEGRDMSDEIGYFDIGLESLREAADVMGGCFDSWLYLHTIELAARELEKSTQQLQQELTKARAHDAFPPACEALCVALELLDEKCAHVLQL